MEVIFNINLKQNSVLLSRFYLLIISNTEKVKIIYFIVKAYVAWYVDRPWRKTEPEIKKLSMGKTEKNRNDLENQNQNPIETQPEKYKTETSFILDS